MGLGGRWARALARGPSAGAGPGEGGGTGAEAKALRGVMTESAARGDRDGSSKVMVAVLASEPVRQTGQAQICSPGRHSNACLQRHATGPRRRALHRSSGMLPLFRS